jgi:hypothetical protein
LQNITTENINENRIELSEYEIKNEKNGNLILIRNFLNKSEQHGESRHKSVVFDNLISISGHSEEPDAVHLDETLLHPICYFII